MRARSQPWTVDDFLAFETQETERYELVDGIVWMMTGGSAAHSAIKGNCRSALDAALRKGPAAPNRRPQGRDRDRRDVPGRARDLPAARPGRRSRTLTQQSSLRCSRRQPRPTTVFAKWREYQTIASLQHFVLVAQSERRIEVYSRDRGSWQLAVVEPPDDMVVLKAIGAKPLARGDLRGQRPLSGPGEAALYIQRANIMSE